VIAGVGGAGTPKAAPNPSFPAKVGLGCWAFDGSSGAVTLGNPPFDNRPFSVALWMKSTPAPMSDRCHRWDRYLALELNSDGAAFSTGRIRLCRQ